LRYDLESDHFVHIDWDEALPAPAPAARSAIPTWPNSYCSGRASNEAAFLYQLLCPRLWHQQFP
jgi:hypothetical protein